ncbi:MAG: YceI family protein [Chloroflexota bacterium]
MKRNILLTLIALVSLLVFAACGPAAPPAAAPEAPAEEAAAEEAPAEEEAAEEEAAEEEGDDEGDDEEGEEAEEMDGEAVTYAVDTEASELVWTGAKAIGDSHSGTIDVAEGSLMLAGMALAGGEFTIDMTSMVGDEFGMVDRLMGHLMSDDFFGVETHPTASLVLNSAEPTDVENQYMVTGDLTIKGITNELTFVTDIEMGDGSMTATADIVFDRALYDVRYGSGSFFDDLGDDLINDEISLVVTLVANQG